MAQDDPYTHSSTGVANGGSFIIDGSNAGTGAIDLTELGGTAAANVYREVDTAGDGTWATSVLIEQPTNNWNSQKNVYTVSMAENVRIRVENTSGASADYYAVGFEVPDSA